MVITRIKPLSCAKIGGTLYAILGVFIGGVISVIALAGGFARVPGAPGAGFISMIGASAIVVMPIFYGCLGFITSLCTAAFYNLAAGMVGGVEMETQ